MILITGAGSGLGAALAKQYDQAGQPLTLLGRSQDKLDKVQASLTQQATTVSVDMADAEQVSRVFDELEQPPVKVIHCAGSGLFGAFEEQDPQAIEQLIRNNLSTTVNLLQQLVRRYQDQPVQVAIVMSTAAQQAKAGESTYCAIKWAVRGLVESLRLELKGKPMKLISVCPGGMATDFWPTSGKTLDTSGFMTADEAAGMMVSALQSTEHGFVSDITINRG